MTSNKLLLTFASTAALTALFTAATPARANCARPVGYEAVVTGNTVQVTPINFDERACPDPKGMLRETPSTGEIVKLADYCVATDELAAYVDECVPPGTYRYGFASPFECSPSSCGTAYFVEATVTDALATTCTRSTGNSAPANASAVPWEDEATIGGGQGGGDQGGGDQGGGDQGGGDQDGGGCSVGLTPGAGSVLVVNALALIAGVGLMRRRRTEQP